MRNDKYFKSMADACVRRWDRAMKEDSVAEAYAAVHDYKDNIQKQEKELESMDPNSKEYSQLNDSINLQRCKCHDMELNQAHEFCGYKMQKEYEELHTRNRIISMEMKNAIHRGDTATYDSLRSQYKKNIASREEFSKLMKRDGLEFKDNLEEERSDVYNHDCSMQETIYAEIEKREQKGKSVSPQKRELYGKYTGLVKEDEMENLKKQGEAKVERLKEAGASEKEIQARERDNQHDMNRFGRGY